MCPIGTTCMLRRWQKGDDDHRDIGMRNVPLLGSQQPCSCVSRGREEGGVVVRSETAKFGLEVAAMARESVCSDEAPHSVQPRHRFFEVRRARMKAVHCNIKKVQESSSGNEKT